MLRFAGTVAARSLLQVGTSWVAAAGHCYGGAAELLARASAAWNVIGDNPVHKQIATIGVRAPRLANNRARAKGRE